MMLADQLSYLHNDILVKSDRAAMSQSLETRSPFLDHHLSDFAWSTPLEWRIRNNKGKHILRDILYKHVPKKLIDRPKQGFEAPLEDWIRNVFSGRIEQFIQQDFLDAQGLFLYQPLRRLFESNQKSGNAEQSAFLYSFMVFQEWWKRLNVGNE